jgi:chromosome segregation ATPase
MASERPKPSAAPSKTAEIDALRAKFDELNTRKTKAETNLENARKQLEKIKAEAREHFGTDDLEALKKKLAEIAEDNKRKTEEYRKSLQKIETDLRAVEDKYKTRSENA